MFIDCCLCFSLPFKTIKAWAEAESLSTLKELQKRLTFGKNCRLCHPYVRRMLRTGETEFREIIREITL